MRYVIHTFLVLLLLTPSPAWAEPTTIGEVVVSDTILSGEVVLAENLIIPEGVKLTFKPGTTVKVIPREGTRTDSQFATIETEINVRGSLVVGRGVSFAPTGTAGRGSWGGIVSAGPEAGVTVDSAEIKWARFGILALKGSVKVKGTRFIGNHIGLGVSSEVRLEASSNEFIRNDIGVLNLPGTNEPVSAGTFKSNGENSLFMASQPPQLAHIRDRPLLTDAGPESREYVGQAALDEDTTWSGTVIIDGQVAVPVGITLTIEPGTRVLFRFRDTNGDGLGESWIIAQGTVRVLGEKDSWVLFDSEETGTRTGMWDSLSYIASDSEDNLVRYALFRRGIKSFHGHFAKVRLEHVVFTNNLRGVQFQESEKTSIDWGTFIGNQSAMRFRDSNVSLSNIVATDNVSGVNFLRSSVDMQDIYMAGNLLESILSRESPTTIKRAAFIGNRRGPRFKGEGEGARLESVLVTHNMEEGLSLNNVNAVIKDAELSHNGLTGISISDAATVVSGSSILGNGRFQVDNNGSTKIDASSNYWGPSGPDPKMIFDGSDQEGLGQVITTGFIKKPLIFLFPGLEPEQGTIAGTMVVTGDIITSPGLDLKFTPGSSVRFTELPAASLFDLCEDHPSFPASELQVLGRFDAIGTADNPVIFAPAGTGPVHPGMWGAVNLAEGKGGTVEHAVFKGSATGLHLRSAVSVRVSDSLFEQNEVGIRFSRTKVDISGNVFRNNWAGIRFHEFGGAVRNNTFDSNGTAVFVTSEPEDVTLTGNTFKNSSQYHIKLGERVSSDIVLNGGQFVLPEGREEDDLMFDKEDEDYLGKVVLKNAQRPTAKVQRGKN